MNISGAILAGGKNKRMGGKNKAFINIGKATIIEKTINLLKPIFDEIILVTNSPGDYRAYEKDCHIITDIIKDSGPLGGIHAALAHTSKTGVFFVACDMPFLHNEVILRQLDCFNKIKCDAVVPRRGGLIEPLHAVYKSSLQDKVRSYLKKSNDYSVKGFLDTVDAYYLDLEENLFYRNIFRNLNTPQDLKAVRKNREEKPKCR